MKPIPGPAQGKGWGDKINKSLLLQGKMFFAKLEAYLWRLWSLTNINISKDALGMVNQVGLLCQSNLGTVAYADPLLLIVV